MQLERFRKNPPPSETRPAAVEQSVPGATPRSSSPLKRRSQGPKALTGPSAARCRRDFSTRTNEARAAPRAPVWPRPIRGQTLWPPARGSPAQAPSKVFHVEQSPCEASAVTARRSARTAPFPRSKIYQGKCTRPRRHPLLKRRKSPSETLLGIPFLPRFVPREGFGVELSGEAALHMSHPAKNVSRGPHERLAGGVARAIPNASRYGR